MITYLNERTQKHQSIFLTAFVAENAPLDLIIGRSTIKKHHFHTSNPSHFVNLENQLNSLSADSTVTQYVKPSEKGNSVALKNGMKTVSSTISPIYGPPATCMCTDPHSKPMNLDLVNNKIASPEGIRAAPMNLDSEQTNFCDLNRNQSDTPPLPAGFATPQRHGWVATLLKQAQLKHISVIIDDEIDDSKTDTFQPFLTPPET